MVGGAGILFGIPSALRLSVFQNQDWVWGVGLMLSGFFFAFAVFNGFFGQVIHHGRTNHIVSTRPDINYFVVLFTLGHKT